MNYNYSQTQQQTAQQQFNSPQPRTYQSTSWNARVRPVSSIEEVRASPIDFDGSIFYFPDIANKRIYTKWINTDGTAGLNMYELKEVPQQEITSDNFVTREEFEEAIMQIRNALMPQQTSAPISEEPQKNPILQF